MGAFFAALGVSLGLLIGYGFPLARSLLCLFVSIIVFLWAKHKRRWIPFLVALAVGIALGALSYYLPYPQDRTVTGIVVKASDSYFVLQTWTHRYYVSLKGHGAEVGDIAWLSGRLSDISMAHYESRFDFASYLAEFGARKQLFTTRIETLFANPVRFRQWTEAYLNRYQGEGKALLASLLFGSKDYDSPSIALADDLNLLFLLSASGLFYGTFLRAVELVLGQWMEKGNDVATLIVGALFLPLGITKVGIVRVWVSRLLAITDKYLLKKDIGYLDRAGMGMLLLLLLDIHYVFNSGFWLGYGIGMTLYLTPYLTASKRKVIGKLKAMVFIRFLLLCCLFYAGGNVHFFGLIYSVLLLPLSVLLLVSGYVGLTGIPMGWAVNGLGEAVSYVLKAFSSFDLSIPIPGDGLWACFLFLGVTFL
ncbi:MAG: DUF4131 domain-containing protein, partial [Bacilli bacterium]|nr:DUF4131 domain-containing protein [Bacilli bacterium]